MAIDKEFFFSVLFEYDRELPIRPHLTRRENILPIMIGEGTNGPIISIGVPDSFIRCSNHADYLRFTA